MRRVWPSPLRSSPGFSSSAVWTSSAIVRRLEPKAKRLSMPPLPPELRVEIRKVGDQYLAVTERASGGEVCSNTFAHDPDKLIHVEPQWMLERGARAPAQLLRADVDIADRPPDDKLLIDYGRRLYGYLFGDGVKL